MSEIKEFTFRGRDCKAAPAPFSDEACELIELFEESGEVNEANLGKEKDDPHWIKFKRNGRMIRLIRKLGKDCLVRGGHTDEEAEEILLSIDLDENDETGIPAFVAAVGLG